MLKRDREVTESDRKLYSDLLEFLPKILPEYVVEVPVKSVDGKQYWKKGITSGLSVIVSIAIYKDGKRWIHLSGSRRMDGTGKLKLPSFEDMVWIKDTFVGAERKAIMVFPEEKYHVNLHEVLHIFYCLDEDPLPEFSGYTEYVNKHK